MGRASGDHTSPQPLDEIKVLYVDADTELGAATARRLELQNEAMHVTTTTSAADALERLAAEPFDCIVSGHDLPRMDGLAFLKRIREAYPTLPFILFTEKGSQDLASDAMDAGVTFYQRQHEGTEQYAVLARRIVDGIDRHQTGQVLADGELSREAATAQLAQSVKQHEAVTRLAELAITADSLDTVFDEAVELVAALLDNACCKVLELQPKQDALLLRSGVGWKDGYVGTATVGTERGSQAGFTLLRKQPVVVSDLRTEKRFYGPDLLVEHDVVSGISVIIGSPASPWGILGTHDTKPRGYTGNDVEFVASVARILESAIIHIEDKQQLKRQTDRLRKLTGILSHDLRNPLVVARGSLELLRDTTEATDHVDRLDGALLRMQTLIEETLTFYKQGSAVEEWERVDLRPLCEQSWAVTDTAAAELVVETDRSIYADSSRLQQLFENLFSNAVRHGGESVTVSVGDLDDGSGFYVDDDGPGIPSALREQVFEEGVSTSDGAGLGLMIVAEIAEAHGWEIALGDSSRGGARFEVSKVEPVRAQTAS